MNHIPDDIKILTKSRIEKEKIIKTKAWIGEDGQGVYEMTINLGGIFIEAYKFGTDLIDSIPGKEEKGWVEINVEKRKIVVNLK